MKEYYVQLETLDMTYGYEVFTDDYNAIEIAREMLGKLIGEEAQDAPLGGYNLVGENFNVNVTKVQMDSKTAHRILQWCEDSILALIAQH